MLGLRGRSRQYLFSLYHNQYKKAYTQDWYYEKNMLIATYLLTSGYRTAKLKMGLQKTIYQCSITRSTSTTQSVRVCLRPRKNKRQNLCILAGYRTGYNKIGEPHCSSPSDERRRGSHDSALLSLDLLHESQLPFANNNQQLPEQSQQQVAVCFIVKRHLIVLHSRKHLNSFWKTMVEHHLRYFQYLGHQESCLINYIFLS